MLDPVRVVTSGQDDNLRQWVRPVQDAYFLELVSIGAVAPDEQYVGCVHTKFPPLLLAVAAGSDDADVRLLVEKLDQSFAEQTLIVDYRHLDRLLAPRRRNGFRGVGLISSGRYDVVVEQARPPFAWPC